MSDRVIGTATIKIKADTSTFVSDLKAAERGGDRFSGIKTGIKTVGVAAIGAGVAIGAMGGEAIEFGAETTKAIDNAKAMFRGLTDSQQQADDVLRRMTEYAINTPFELPQLSQTTAQLLAVGDGFGVTADNVFEAGGAMDTLGNAIAATGGNNDTLERTVRVFGQMSSSGKVLGQDMNQLAQNMPGFDVWQTLADGTGKSVEELRELQDAGKLDELLTGNEAVKILMDGMTKLPGAAGAMERKMDTLEGSMSKFKEQMGLALYKGLAPFFDTLQTVMGNPVIMSALEDLIAAFSTFASEIVEGLAPFLPDLVDGFTAMFDALGPVAPVIGKLAGIFGKLMSAAAPILELILDAVVDMLPSFESLLDAIKPIIPVIGVLLIGALKVLTTLLEPLLPIIEELAGMFIDSLAAILPTIVEAFIKLAEALAPVVEMFAEQFLVIMEALLPLLPTIADLILVFVEAFVPLLPVIAQLAILFTSLLVPALEIAVPLIQLLIDIWGFLIEKLGWVIEKVAGFVGSIVEWFQKLYDKTVGWVVDLVTGIIEFFQNLFNELVGNSIIPDLVEAILGFWEWLLTPITVAVQAIIDVVTAIWEALSTAIDVILDGIAVILDTAWEVIKTAASTAWDLIKAAVMAPIELLEGLIQPIIDAVKALFDFTGLADTVLAIFEGIKDAIVGPIEDAVGLVAGAVDKIKSALSWVNPFDNEKTLGNIGAAVNVPKKAFGGIVNHPTLSVIGEAGREVVIPLTNPGRAMQLASASGLTAMLAGQGAGGPLVQMNGTVIQDATDADLVAQRTVVAIHASLVA